MERRMKKNASAVARVAAVPVLLAALVFGATGARGNAPFGTLCQADYQNGWQNTLPNSWDRCAWFNGELNDTDTQVFYRNLHGAETLYSSCDGCANGGADTVELLYTNTHGGALNRGNASLAMWDQNSSAQSISDGWRLGDESSGLSFMANYACETLTNADSSSSLINRWRNTFRGGMRMALGSQDKLWDSITTNECGEDFADSLQDGDSVKWAWLDGNGDWYEDQDVKVLATGTSSSNCTTRKDKMTWQNFGNYPQLFDGSVVSFCSTKIDNN